MWIHKTYITFHDNENFGTFITFTYLSPEYFTPAYK